MFHLHNVPCLAQRSRVLVVTHIRKYEPLKEESLKSVVCDDKSMCEACQNAQTKYENMINDQMNRRPTLLTSRGELIFRMDNNIDDNNETNV